MDADRWHLIVTEWVRSGRESALRLGQNGWPRFIQMLLPPRFSVPTREPEAIPDDEVAVTIMVEVIDGVPCFSCEGRPLP